MESQMTIFDFIEQQEKYSPGEEVPLDKVGRKLSFDEAYNYIGRIVGYYRNMQSMSSCTAVRIRKIFTFTAEDPGHRAGIRRAVCDDSSRKDNPLLIDDCYYDGGGYSSLYPSYFVDITENESNPIRTG